MNLDLSCFFSIMSDDFNSSNLFDSFGLGTPKQKTSVYTRFPDDDDNFIEIVDEINSSGTHESSSIGGVIPPPSSTPKMKPEEENFDNSVKITVPMKFIEFLKRIAGPERSELNDQLTFLMKTYEESENTKLSSDTGFRLDSRPTYESTLFSTPFDGETKNATPDKNGGPTAPKIVCFNCEKEHSISECTEPRDQQRINRNLALNRSKQQRRTQDGNRRYAEDSLKYSQFKPGIISDDLRRALGLKPREIPLWIYQMRILGYPPGHLLEALSQPSNLTMFDDNDCPLGASENNNKSFYDMSRIIEYPGFNVPLPAKVTDECASYNMPPMLPHQQKETFVAYLNSNNATIDNYSTKSNRNKKSEQDASIKNEIVSMDISDDDFSPLQPKSHLSLLPTPQTSVECTPRPVSPSESELERERQRILDQLMNSSTRSSSIDGGDNLDRQNSLTINVDVTNSSNADVCILSPDLENIIVDQEFGTPLITRSHSSRSLSVTLGTPTLSSSSTSTKKPSLESFRQDVNKFEPKEETPPCRGGGMKKIKELLHKRKKN